MISSFLVPRCTSWLETSWGPGELTQNFIGSAPPSLTPADLHPRSIG